jgi:hypothetical protein
LSIDSQHRPPRYTIDSIFPPFQPGVTERCLKVPSGNYSAREVIDLLVEIDEVKYEIHVSPVSEARRLQEAAREAGSSDLELAYSLKALFASPYLAVPKPWHNELSPLLLAL